MHVRNNHLECPAIPADSARTRAKLLDAACRLFADKGFRTTTVADICRQAGASIAAVNYHFGSKENLYRQAWRHAHALETRSAPPDGGVPPHAPAEERLRGRIRGVLQRVLAAEGMEFRIMAHEMSRPTGLLKQVIHDAIGPLREATLQAISDLLGGQASEELLRSCEASVIGPLMDIGHRQRMSRLEGMGPVFGPEVLEPMVEHFTAFALAGIRDIRRRTKRGQISWPERPRRHAMRPGSGRARPGAPASEATPAEEYR
jgi:TetR/AcrR family transcriptional regulator, regulator of cefoperazone and chloramphenicol sensitivity